MALPADDDLSAEIDKAAARLQSQGRSGSASSFQQPAFQQPVYQQPTFQQPAAQQSYQSGVSGSIGSAFGGAVVGSQISGAIGSARQISSSTLDESVSDTLKRDVFRVIANLKAVLLPGIRGTASDSVKALRDWDLWGPLIFTIVLAVLLSLQSDNPQSVFALVFAIVWFGAVALTLNVLLLGGQIIFFQSVALLGYCLCPLTLAAIFCLIWGNNVYQLILLVLGILWSTRSALPVISAAVPESRRILAIYPVLLLYFTLGWIALVSE